MDSLGFLHRIPQLSEYFLETITSELQKESRNPQPVTYFSHAKEKTLKLLYPCRNQDDGNLPGLRLYGSLCRTVADDVVRITTDHRCVPFLCLGFVVYGAVL